MYLIVLLLYKIQNSTGCTAIYIYISCKYKIHPLYVIILGPYSTLRPFARFYKIINHLYHIISICIDSSISEIFYSSFCLTTVGEILPLVAFLLNILSRILYIRLSSVRKSRTPTVLLLRTV